MGTNKTEISLSSILVSREYPVSEKIELKAISSIEIDELKKKKEEEMREMEEGGCMSGGGK